MKFRTMYNNTTLRTGQDLSNEYEQTYKELAPYERNEKGEFLNDSPFPKLVLAEKVNIQERIQSFFEDVDLYHLLAKMAVTGDVSFLNKKAGFYADISNIPNNYNDINEYYKNLSKQYNALDPKIKDLINSGLDDQDLENAINELNNKDVKQDVKIDVKADIKKEVNNNENK